MAAITEFAQENAGMKRDKKDASTTKGYTRAPNMSLGLMCGSDITERMLLLDSCSQEHVIKDLELMENMCKCESDIHLSGIVGHGTGVRSMGCGTALGVEAYYVPGASSNLISYAKLLNTGYQIESSDGGRIMNVLRLLPW
jgi:hypothetical protein